jgi:diguanylate cyclase (GGDEF)-like protein
MLLESVQTNLISILILLIIYFSLIKHAHKKYYLNKIFYILLWSNITILAFDSIAVYLSGDTSLLARALMMLSISVYYILQLIIVMFWMFYITFNVEQNMRAFKYVVLVAGPLLAVQIIYTLLSLNGNYLFYIDQNNMVFRGELFFLSPLFAFSLVFISLVYVLLNRLKLKKTDFWALIVFPIPTVIAAILQLIYQNLNLMWPSMVLSILIVYIYIQSRMTNTDALTGVYNRREYEYQIAYRLNNRHQNKVISGIMIDINDFKMINDDYCHRVGDIALVQLVAILRNSVRKDDFIARIGGDEFVVIIESQSEAVLYEVTSRISKNLAIFNSKADHDYQLSIAMGFGVYDEQKYDSFQDFFEELDHRMYDSKKENKTEVLSTT